MSERNPQLSKKVTIIILLTFLLIKNTLSEPFYPVPSGNEAYWTLVPFLFGAYLSLFLVGSLPILIYLVYNFYKNKSYGLFYFITSVVIYDIYYVINRNESFLIVMPMMALYVLFLNFKQLNISKEGLKSLILSTFCIGCLVLLISSTTKIDPVYLTIFFIYPSFVITEWFLSPFNFERVIDNLKTYTTLFFTIMVFLEFISRMF